MSISQLVIIKTLGPQINTHAQHSTNKCNDVWRVFRM